MTPFHHKTFADEVKTAVQVALFNEKDIHHVAGDKNKTPYAFYIIAIGAILSMLGMHFFSPFGPTFIRALFGIIMQVAFMIIGIYVLSFIAQKLFNGHAKHDAFFRAVAYGSIVGWLGLIPFLSFISGLWGLALLFFILKTVHKITTGQAVLTIIIGIVAIGLIGMIAFPSYGMYGGKMHMGGGYGSFEMNIPNYR